MKTARRLLALLLCLVFVFGIAACDKTTEDISSDDTSKPEEQNADVPADRRDASARTGKNATNPLVIATQTLDGKFNPFYATSGYDTSVVDMTQIKLITSNENAEPVAGADENTLALSFEMRVNDDGTESTYEFILKRGISFSDGTPVTGRDVLFNIYTYLDPAYGGSSTLYSMDIKGLKSYRTQTLDEDDALQKDEEFGQAALERVTALVEGTGSEQDEEAAWDQVLTFLRNDTALIKEYFAMGYNLADLGAPGTWPTDFPANAAILIFYGMIESPKGNITATVESVEVERLYEYTEEEAIQLAYDYIKGNMSLVEYDMYSGHNVLTDGISEASSEESVMFEVFKKQEAEEYLEQNKGNVKNVSGITLDTVTEGDIERERITVVINGVDPKAIWSFGFYVAPMHYYSTPALAQEANGVDAFGVDFNSKEFQNQLKQKVVPLGAGPYAAADNQGKKTGEFEKFYANGIVNFVANDDFMLSAPLIKYIRFKVINSGSELSVLQSGEVHFAEPPAQTTIINQIAGTNFSGILVDALGYGYIGINSALIPDIYARRAITSAFNTDLALEYYTNGLATIIHRPMSRVSWAYPRNADNMYPFDETGETSKALFLQSDSFIEEDGNVVYADGSKVTYTFSLPMDIADHPTGQIFLEAKKVLEKIGVEVTVEEDYYLTDKLQDDVVSVWAAAWQAEIDPDKFQVYYSDPEVNTAGSPKQFGLYHMFENGTDEEKKLLDNINELIIQGRESLNTDERKPVYEQMLNLIMELCVEIPVYQRNDMFVYNSGVIDGETLWGNVTPYKNPLSEIWDVSLVLE